MLLTNTMQEELKIKKDLMGFRILVVDDNKDILFNIQLILESRGINVIPARNGKEALAILSDSDEVPDMIISDIMMPQMNGYDFFKTVSTNSRLSSIPFIFLTARSSPEDVRLGKLLGVDDYITKPINEKDLVAIVQGKISRFNKIKNYNNILLEAFREINLSLDPSVSKEEVDLILLLLMYWDDAYGPELLKYHPSEKKIPYSIENIGFQLFNAASLIYGQGRMLKAEGILLNIDNIKMSAYVYFNAQEDNSTRSGQRLYMLSVIAPKINYFESLQIKEVLARIFSNVKENVEWNVEHYYSDVIKILSSNI
ncbi:MAG: response regulator [Candidatus Lokiarchaeota archaeon]|nr:response regulator [Candidatus Lokiarchaeota archaeon]